LDMSGTHQICICTSSRKCIAFHAHLQKAEPRTRYFNKQHCTGYQLSYTVMYQPVPQQLPYNGKTVRHSLTHHQSESLHCVVYDCISTMTTPHPGHVRSVQVRPGQVRSGQVRSVAYNTRCSQTDRGTGSTCTLDDVSVNSHINLSLLTLLLLFSPTQSPGQKSHNASSAVPRQKDVSRKTVRLTPFSLSPLPKSEMRLSAVVRPSF